MTGERSRVEQLRAQLGAVRPPVLLGIGDDAAALHIEGIAVASVDAAVEGVHFERAWLSFGDLGYRTTQAAFSDLAAMGARPLCALSALVLPADVSDADLAALAEGQAEACRELEAQLVGGNLSRGTELSITTTVLGSAATRVLTRSGAQPGDGLWLAGEVGWAAAGLAALRAGLVHDPAVTAWRRPRARIDEGLRAAAVAHAAIDLSDGLAHDAGQMADASGVALVLDAAALPSDLVPALQGGEDYGLLVAARSAIKGFRRVGSVEAGKGLWLEGAGPRRAITPDGWDHFG